MKSAKEMFKELGYKEDIAFGNDICYSKAITETMLRGIDIYWTTIYFNKSEKVVSFCAKDSYEFWTQCSIEPKAFKAITKQMEELGWLQ